jgi:hypothetical protein
MIFNCTSPAETWVTSALSHIFIQTQLLDGNINQRCKIHIKADTTPNSNFFEFEHFLSNELQDLSVGVHTHLLPNSINDITVSIINTEGAILESRSLAFKSENIGDLSKKVREKLKARNTPIFFTGPIDSSQFDYDDQDMLPWFDLPDAHEKIDQFLEDGTITENLVSPLRNFVDDGYIILPKPIEEQLVDQVNSEIDLAIGENYQNYTYGSSNVSNYYMNIILDVGNYGHIPKFSKF